MAQRRVALLPSYVAALKPNGRKFESFCKEEYRLSPLSKQPIHLSILYECCAALDVTVVTQ